MWILTGVLLNEWLISQCIGWTAGSPRVAGDEEEDDIDDLEHEFDYGNSEAFGPTLPAGVIHSSNGYVGHPSSSQSATFTPALEVPLLTYGEVVIDWCILILSLFLRLMTISFWAQT